MSLTRLILDSPASGAWNMAADEALLESAAERGAATLRFYTWQEATLSLGYFQAHAERASHAASQACPLVRRASGGGAIVHHLELTYSFVAPLDAHLAADAEALYHSFHETLIDTLGAFGISAAQCDTPVIHERGREPFLCFQRRAKGDVLCGDAKIAGSAQRRHRGVVLQHGSVLLMRSPQAPELPGVAELSGRVISYPELITAWAPAIAVELGLALEPGELTATEQAAAARIESEKFASPGWNERR